MTVRKTLTSIVLAGALALGLDGCGKNETAENINSQNYQEVHQQVKDDWYGGHGTNLKASRVNYLQNQKVIENNIELLEQRGLEIDISQYLRKAGELHLSAENNWYGGHRANLTYKEALFQQNEAILAQQEALLGEQE